MQSDEFQEVKDTAIPFSVVGDAPASTMDWKEESHSNEERLMMGRCGRELLIIVVGLSV